jgi:hypothetical protein
MAYYCATLVAQKLFKVKDYGRAVYRSVFFKEFSLGGGAKQGKRQNEKYEPSRFGKRESLERDFVKL